MKGQKRKIANGFTLIELMVVVVIIGILAALAIPRFMSSATKSKQSEAKQLLKQVYSMQRSYFMLNGGYCLNGISANTLAPTAFNLIHVGIMPTARYTYTMVAGANSFSCTAVANLDDDIVMDSWTIDDSGVLANNTDDATD